MPIVFVNPKVERFGEEIVWEEGCLSLPEIRGHVTRPSQIRVSYQDLDGHAHTLECEGLLARCIQHEQDHLNGVLFIDAKRMPETERKRLEPEIKALREKTQKALGNSH